MVLAFTRRSGCSASDGAEQALAFPENDREDEQLDLIDQASIEQRAPQLVAGVDHDGAVDVLLELRGFLDRVAAQDRRVRPAGLVERRRDDVLGQGVQGIRPVVGAFRPAGSEPLLGAPSQQKCLDAERLLEHAFAPHLEVLAGGLGEPAAEPETLLSVGILDDSIERHVGADHEFPHGGCFLSSVM